MTEWLKNICFSPFKYGLNGINIVAMNAVSVIFNLCGKRLFKIDSDKIIRSNEYKDDRDIFYMYPLNFQQMEQDLGLNIIKLESGVVNNLIISVPWKELLSKPTLITIDNIELIISFTQNQNSIYINSLENTNSYFFNSKNRIGENQDLMNAYKEIKSLLTQYFDKINLDIKTIDITIIDYFKIRLTGINYSNGIININSLNIHTNSKDTDTMQELVSVENIVFNMGNNNLFIDKVIVNPVIVDYCPQYYTDNSKNDFMCNININFFQLDRMMIYGLSIYITNNDIIIKNISRATVDNILLLVTDNDELNNDFIMYNVSNNICLFGKKINLKISSFFDVSQWLNHTKTFINNMTNKVIIVETLEKSQIDELSRNQSMQINNISSNIVYGEDLFFLCIEKIVCDDNIQAFDIKFVYNDILGRISHFTHYKNGMNLLFDSDIKSNNFHLNSKKTKISKNDNCIDIYLNYANASNITEIINFVTKTIEKITTNREPVENIDKLDLSMSITDLSTAIECCNEKKKPLSINLNLSNTNLTIAHEKNIFNFIIMNVSISITDRNAKKVEVDILLNNYLIARLRSEYISESKILLDSLYVYIDPEIFDQINYIFGTLTPESQIDEYPAEISAEGLKQLQEALFRSIIFENNDCQDSLSNEVNETNTDIKINSEIYSDVENIHDNPQIKFFTTSVANLCSVLIDDYDSEVNKNIDTNFTIFIDTIHCYFFDKLLASNNKNKGSPAFLCAILKNVEFIKIKELAKEDKDKPLITVYEKGRNNKPKYLDKYSLMIKTGALIDVQCRDPEWKYFVKFSKENMLNAYVTMHGDVFRSTINMGSITTNIREEILLHLLAFFSHTHHVPKNNNYLHIEYFRINSIDLIINYYPLIIKKIGMGVDPNTFALKNFKIKLSSHVVTNVDSFDKLGKCVTKKIIDEINPDNILQFVPNIRVVQPYALPMMNLFNLTKRYFNNPDNKQKIRMITKNISKGADMISALVKNNVEQVFELFME